MDNKLITHFHLRKNTIYLRLTVNGERAEISTNKTITAKTGEIDHLTPD
jgi:hypothetical protein